MADLTMAMTDEELLAALAGLDSSDEWLALQRAEPGVRERVAALRGEGGESESSEEQGQEAGSGPPVPDGTYDFIIGDDGAMYVYRPPREQRDPSDVVAYFPPEEVTGVVAGDVGTVARSGGVWSDDYPATGNVYATEETGSESQSESEDATATASSWTVGTGTKGKDTTDEDAPDITIGTQRGWQDGQGEGGDEGGEQEGEGDDSVLLVTEDDRIHRVRPDEDEPEEQETEQEATQGGGAPGGGTPIDPAHQQYLRRYQRQTADVVRIYPAYDATEAAFKQMVSDPDDSILLPVVFTTKWQWMGNIDPAVEEYMAPVASRALLGFQRNRTRPNVFTISSIQDGPANPEVSTEYVGESGRAAVEALKSMIRSFAQDKKLYPYRDRDRVVIEER